jgi:hypothetical protein
MGSTHDGGLRSPRGPKARGRGDENRRQVSICRHSVAARRYRRMHTTRRQGRLTCARALISQVFRTFRCPGDEWPQDRNAICLPVPLRRGTWPRPEGQESRRRPVNGHGRAGLGVRLHIQLAPALPPTAGDAHVRTPWREGSFHAAPIALQSPGTGT